MTLWGLVLAGGEGRRFGTPKQFELLRGRTLLEHAISLVRPHCEGVLVVLPPGSSPAACSADLTVAGGATRSGSVRNGLAGLPADADRVLIHDAAHPLASLRLFSDVIAALTPSVCGALPVIALANTMAWVEAGLITRVQSKEGVHTMQMPMAFWVDALAEAHARDSGATDDASLMVSLGHPVAAVEGDPGNLHITTIADLRLAEAVLDARTGRVGTESGPSLG